MQIASRFVATKECDASPAYKQAYINARQEDVQIIQSPVGMPGRALRNAFIKQLDNSRIPISKCYNCLEKCNPAKVPYCITKALINAVKGDVDNGLIFCGDNVGRINKIYNCTLTYEGTYRITTYETESTQALVSICSTLNIKLICLLYNSTLPCTTAS